MLSKIVLSLLIGLHYAPLLAREGHHAFSSSSHHQTHQDFTKENTKLFLLITGCARSGTTYISEVLQHCGLDIQHEAIGKDGCCSWFMNVEDDSAPWDRPTAKGYSFEHIFHQVRNPLDVISSVSFAEHRDARAFFRRHLPQIDVHDPQIVQSAKYWYYWNLEAEKKAEWRYRIEDIEIVLDEMSQRLNLPLSHEPLKIISKKTNHRHKYKKLTWRDLKRELPEDLFHNIQEMSLRYGYPIAD